MKIEMPFFFWTGATLAGLAVFALLAVAFDTMKAVLVLIAGAACALMSLRACQSSRPLLAVIGATASVVYWLVPQEVAP